MVKYLLDTCVISELRKPTPDKAVKVFLEKEADAAFLSAITMGEIMFGIRKISDGKQKKSLLLWFKTLESQFAESILAFDQRTCILWGEIRAECSRKGKSIPVIDALIAATAKQHNLTLVTRNVTDFKHTGIYIYNPWK